MSAPELFLIPTNMGLTFLCFIDEAAIVAVLQLFYFIFSPHASSSPLLSHLHFGRKSLEYMLCYLQKKTQISVWLHTMLGCIFSAPSTLITILGCSGLNRLGTVPFGVHLLNTYLSSLEKFSIQIGKWYIPC